VGLIGNTPSIFTLQRKSISKGIYLVKKDSFHPLRIILRGPKQQKGSFFSIQGKKRANSPIDIFRADTQKTCTFDSERFFVPLNVFLC
jgi:hypothetical protein